MKDYKILTLNPDPNKKGVSIDKTRYDFIRKNILDLLRDEGLMGAVALVNQMDMRLGGDSKVGYSIGWYTTAIRLDLEARSQVVYDRSKKKPVVSLPD